MSYTPFINDPCVGEFVAAKVSLPWREMGQDMADILNAFLDAASRKTAQLDSATIATSLGSIVPRLKKARLKDATPMLAAYVRWAGENCGLGNAAELARVVEAKGGELCSMDEKKRTPAKSGGAEIGRNDPCSCGSGKKFKKCCGVAAG